VPNGCAVPNTAPVRDGPGGTCGPVVALLLTSPFNCLANYAWQPHRPLGRGPLCVSPRTHALTGPVQGRLGRGDSGVLGHGKTLALEGRRGSCGTQRCIPAYGRRHNRRDADSTMRSAGLPGGVGCARTCILERSGEAAARAVEVADLGRQSCYGLDGPLDQLSVTRCHRSRGRRLESKLRRAGGLFRSTCPQSLRPRRN